MGWFAKIAWALGMWMGGSFVMSMFGSQIRIVNACTKKLIRRWIYPELLYIDALSKYLNSVIIKNVIIITIITALIVLFVPSIGIYSYFLGMFITWITSIGAVGLTPDNIEESFSVFQRYVKPNAEGDSAELLDVVKERLLFEAKFKAGVYQNILEKRNK